MSEVTVGLAASPADRAACLALRREVFVGEQNVPEAEEMDGLDESCAHVLAREGGAPIGAARYRRKGDAVKIERVCVPQSARGRGVGARMMRFILERARADTDADFARLGAQTHALAFYQALGFRAYGPEYLDAGIPHRDMELPLRG